MNLRSKTYYISFIILLVCLLITLIIYRLTGNVIIAILFAPPLIHWILKRRSQQDGNDGY